MNMKWNINIIFCVLSMIFFGLSESYLWLNLILRLIVNSFGIWHIYVKVNSINIYLTI